MDPCSRRQSRSSGCTKIQPNNDPSKEGGLTISLRGLCGMPMIYFQDTKCAHVRSWDLESVQLCYKDARLLNCLGHAKVRGCLSVNYHRMSKTQGCD